MTFDMFESSSLDKASINVNEKLSSLHEGFQSRMTPEYNAYMDMPESFSGNVMRWLGIDTTDAAAELGALKVAAMDTVKQMYSGVDLGNGEYTLGLKAIGEMHINPEFKYQNERQHAGFAAEVIGTAKENLKAKMDSTGVTTCRADDLPDLFPKNDQYVDKVRMDSAGNILEKVQVKFVGKNPAECLSKLMSKKYDKYFNDGKVDKMEVPKDYYDGIKKLIPEKIGKLEEQLQHVKENGNEEAAKGIEAKIERYKKVDEMLEKSTVSSSEALQGVRHPRLVSMKLFAKDTFASGHKSGLESAKFAVSVTAAVSTIDNFSKVMEGEITIQEAFADVAKDTGTAGGVAYGTAFISTAVSQTMSASSHTLISSLGQSNIPATVISFGVQSYDAISDYASGVIDGKELAYELGENAARVGGGAIGTAVATAAVGSVVPGAGTVVGFGVGLVGSTVCCAVASEAYESAVEFGAEHADELADKAQEMMNKTVEIATEVIPDQVGNVVASLNEFAATNNLPFSI